jgi:hypothetical protein
MRNLLLLLVGVLLLAACSAPKYSYYFDHYDYNSGKKKISPDSRLAISPVEAPTFASEVSPLSIPEETLVASTEPGIVVAEKKVEPVVDQNILAKKYSSLNKTEKKAFRKELKSEIKKYMKAKKSGDNGAAVENTKVMDYNLKMSIIFCAIALTLSFFGGVNSVFWIISVVTLVIGIVFFIKWIAEQ